MSNQELFHYVACGLSNVWLQNGYTVRDTPEGPAYHIEQVKDLHEAIGLYLAQKDSMLTPDEFRFLRTEMQLSRRSLGDILGVTMEAVKKWESGENTPPKTTDACLREIYLRRTHHEEVRNLIEQINHLERENRDIRLNKTSQGWQKQAC